LWLLRQLEFTRYNNCVRVEGVTAESDDLRGEIEQRQASLEDLPGRVEEATDELKWKERTDDVKVSLIDKTSFTIREIQFSDKSDLASFKLPAQNCTFLTLHEDPDIPQGSKLYTIGNSSGLGYTVTAGIFSGYQSIDSQRLIQTEASINPGNSGGPLIKENGNVVGVNTLVLKGTQGIGFAIPADVIKREFSHLSNN